MYVPLDVNFPDDEKVMAAGLDGAGLYAHALCIAKRRMSDGQLIDAHLVRLGATPELIDRLIEVDLLHRDDDGSLWITAFLVHNDSADELDSRRANDAARKRRSRRNRPTGHVTPVPEDTSHPSENVTAIEVEIEGETERESSTPVVPLPTIHQPIPDDPASRLAAQDLERRQTEAGPVGNPVAWLRSARAGHQRKIDADPDYLARALGASTVTRPSPLDATAAASAARMERNARRANGTACPTCDDQGLIISGDPQDTTAGPCPDCTS